MIRDYDSITPEQEAAETVVFGQWWDWFFEKQGISQDTTFDLEIGKRSIRDFKEMFMNDFPLQESTLTYLPGVAKASDKDTFLKYLEGTMDSFAKAGFLR